MHPNLSRRGILAALITAPFLSACGFRLRGSFTAPFETMYLQMTTNTPFHTVLKQSIETGSNVRVVNRPQEAEAILEILRMECSRDVLTFNDTGLAREYELTLDVEFRLTAPDGWEYVPPTRLSSSRDLTYSESEFLSREKEEATLYADMENDVIAQLVRYIEAAKGPDQQ